jgi:hypothetical protein
MVSKKEGFQNMPQIMAYQTYLPIDSYLTKIALKIFQGVIAEV